MKCMKSFCEVGKPIASGIASNAKLKTYFQEEQVGGSAASPPASSDVMSPMQSPSKPECPPRRPGATLAQALTEAMHANLDAGTEVEYDHLHLTQTYALLRLTCYICLHEWWPRRAAFYNHALNNIEPSRIILANVRKVILDRF